MVEGAAAGGGPASAQPATAAEAAHVAVFEAAAPTTATTAAENATTTGPVDAPTSTAQPSERTLCFMGGSMGSCAFQNAQNAVSVHSSRLPCCGHRTSSRSQPGLVHSSCATCIRQQASMESGPAAILVWHLQQPSAALRFHAEAAEGYCQAARLQQRLTVHRMQANRQHTACCQTGAPEGVAGEGALGVVVLAASTL